MDSKSFKVFNMLQKGFTNSFSIIPLLKELYEQVELISTDELEELSKKHPSIAEIIIKIKAIVS